MLCENIIPGNSFIEELRKKKVYDLNKKSNILKLNDSFSKIDFIPGLKTTLYRHQQTAIKAMLELESTRSLIIDNDKVMYNAGVLSEPVGSGKTIDILGVICINKIPKVKPDIIPLPVNAYYMYNRFYPFVLCKYKHFITSTIIFVGSSVLYQWIEAINTFTDLTVFTVKSVIELKMLFNMIENHQVNRYDIILVKNGKISVPIRLPNDYKLEIKNQIRCPYIYNLISNLRSHCWARVVVDDFDTIKLPNNAGIVKGIFTWYISSTFKYMSSMNRRPQYHHLTSDFLTYSDFGCSNIMQNLYLFKLFNVCNTDDYIKSTCLMPYPKYHIVEFKNPNNLFISMLANMGNEEISRISEMLNGDAINEAAEVVGIKSNSVADIFSNILGNKYKAYRFYCDLLDYIEYVSSDEEVNNRIAMKNNEDKKDTYGKKDLLNFREIQYQYVGIDKLLKETYEEYTELKNTCSLEIQRVKDNIKHGICPICLDDLSEVKDIIIVKCCNQIFCGECGIQAQNFNKKENLYCSRCSNCRAKLSIKDIIYIGNTININDITNENFESDSDSDEELSNDVANRNIDNYTKFDAIIDIIKNKKVLNDVRVDLHIPNMMKGSKYMKEIPTRKVLIFANFTETLDKIIDLLTTNNIKFWELKGTSKNMSNLSIAFTKCKQTCALVINSSQHCAGLNLQTATDLIFAHKMINSEVESQVAGRGHRLGRTSPLNIWYLLYDNEYQSIKKSHSVRILTKKELKQQ